MLDIKFIRQNPQAVRDGSRKKGVKVEIDKLLKVDKKRRKIILAIEDIAAKKNNSSRKISQTKNKKEKKKLILEMRKIDTNSDRLNKDLKKLSVEFNDLMYQIPNLPEDDVPFGKNEKDNVVLKKWGKKLKFGFKPKDSLEIGENLDLIDVKRAAKVSGTRFGYIKKEAALIEFALINLAFDTLSKEGFIPIVPPVFIKEEAMRAMGYINNKEDLAERYFFKKDKLFLVGTSEQSIGPIHQDEIFKEKDLPQRYVAFSSCFRREAGSYGKDTRGILRVHQFDKVEMFSFAHPKQSKEEYKFLLSIEEKLMQQLKIPYQVVQMCTGDLGNPVAAKYDIEAWLPSQNKYRETHSASNTTDFQTRRLNIRYRNSKTKKLDFVHTLNGTTFAIGRMLIAIIENYQQKDGSVKIPEALQKYLNFQKIG